MKTIISILLLIIFCSCEKNNPAPYNFTNEDFVQVDVYSNHKHVKMKVEDITTGAILFNIMPTELIDTVKKQALVGCIFNLNKKSSYRISYEVLDTNKTAYLAQPLFTKMIIRISGYEKFNDFGQVKKVSDTTVYSSNEYFLNQ